MENFVETLSRSTVNTGQTCDPECRGMRCCLFSKIGEIATDIEKNSQILEFLAEKTSEHPGLSWMIEMLAARLARLSQHCHSLD